MMSYRTAAMIGRALEPFGTNVLDDMVPWRRSFVSHWRLYGMGGSWPKVKRIPWRVRVLRYRRGRARAARNFALADRLRSQIQAAGFHVADGPLRTR